MNLVIHPRTKIFLDKLFGKIENDGIIHHPFWLVHGEKHGGKSTVLEERVSAFLGNYVSSDFLHIKDFSTELGKTHSLKIEYKRNDQTDELAKSYMYEDLGVREIKTWLARSPIGDFKVVLIENIDRITLSSANALLKTIEEPQEGTLIIGTTSNLSSLLDTIVSRALLVPYSLPDGSTVDSYLASNYSEINLQDRKAILSLSQGRIGLAVNIADMLQSDEGHDFLHVWKEYLRLVENTELVSLHKFFVKQHKDGFLDELLTMMQYYAIDSHNFFLSNTVVQTKKYLERNVSVEGTLLRLATCLK